MTCFKSDGHIQFFKSNLEDDIEVPDNKVPIGILSLYKEIKHFSICYQT